MTNETLQPAAGPTAGAAWKPLLLIGAVIIVIFLSWWFDLATQFQALRDWIRSLGAVGPLVFIGIYVGATVAALPGSALTVVAGAIFGSVLGVAVTIVAATLGASLSFLIARYFARDATEAWLSKSDKFQKLAAMTEQHGATVVALTRLVPIFPFNLLNYGFGLTRVPFGTYVFWSAVCMLPGTVLYVVGADVLSTALSEGQVPWGLVAGAAAAAGLLAVLVRYARGRLET